MVTPATFAEKHQLNVHDRGCYFSRPMTRLGLKVMLNEALRRNPMSGTSKRAERGRFAFKKRGPKPK